VGGRISCATRAGWRRSAPPLLIADLGRPERFLAMMRVFKLRSPMSVGAWTLFAFGTTSGAAAFADLVDRLTNGKVPVRVLGNAAEALAAATGVVLSTYTGVLIGATAIPAWQQNVKLLPIHFGASGLGTAVAILELLGHRDPALNHLGVGVAAAETLIGTSIEFRRDPALVPLRGHTSGVITRAGGVLSGPVPLALRFLATVGRSPEVRKTAAICTIVGSLLTRYAWVAAGRDSARHS
jgi:formate-dependent nitrite reductase membrane component NrfD